MGTSADQYVISHGHRKAGGQLGDPVAWAVCYPQPPSVKPQGFLWSGVRGAGPSSHAVGPPSEALWTVPPGTTREPRAVFFMPHKLNHFKPGSEVFGGRGQRSQSGAAGCSCRLSLSLQVMLKSHDHIRNVEGIPAQTGDYSQII